MISKEGLAKLLNACKVREEEGETGVVIEIGGETLRELIEAYLSLEKEADWLAKYATGKSPCIKPLFDCREAGQINQCHICLRDVARKTVQNV